MWSAGKNRFPFFILKCCCQLYRSQVVVVVVATSLSVHITTANHSESEHFIDSDRVFYSSRLSQSRLTLVQMANISYQQIREQLINLNVDLEDKSKICKILEQKTKDERNQLSTIEAAFEEKYQAIIEVTAAGWTEVA
jgi:signal recognition particle GTPase